MSQVDLKSVLSRMNLDDSYYHLGKLDYADALNITTDSNTQSQDIPNTNIVGNQAVDYTLPTGDNVCIRGKEDVLRNRVFEFIWNSTNYHSILIYDLETGLRTKLIENLTDTGGLDVLQFTLLNKINHCDILYRGEDEGDLMFWTDGNVSLRKINIKHIQDGIYTVLKVPFIELAKQPPRVPIKAVYGNDATRNANSLRKKLIQATYRFCYDDFEKSTFTTYSKIPLPIGYYGSDNDIDSGKNNFITLTVETGDENVTDIEIAVRFNIASDWQDFVLAISLNKAQLNIPSNSTYDYLFYNDAIYPPLDVEEVTQLFDWVPKKADSQVLANGNSIVPAGITEGYANYPASDIDVTLTVDNVTNVPPDTDPPTITYVQGANTFTFTVSGSVPTGTRYKIYIFFNGDYTIGETYGVRLVADYTSIVSDTINDVAFALYSQFNSYSSVPVIGGSYSTNFWNSTFGTSGNSVFQLSIVAGSSGAGTISTEKTWLWSANYIFGQDYKDDQGRIMPGVTTLVNPTDSDNDYLVTTPSFDLDGASVQTPVITAEVNHLPPNDAVTFGWVRRRMTYSNFLMYMTCDYQDGSDGYLYFCLANVEKYKIKNSQFIYGTAPITTESRIKIIAGITSNAYNGDIWTQDYEILGTVVKTITGGSSPTGDFYFIKVKKPDATILPAYTARMLVMIYTPMANPTDIADSVYKEWGEEYAIYDGVNLLYSNLTGTFAEGESVSGGTSGAVGTIVSDNGTPNMTLSDVTGTFVVGETILGATSAATALVGTVSYQRYHRGMTQDQTFIQPAIYVWAEGDVYFHDRTMYENPIVTGATTSDTVALMDANWSDFFLSAVNDNGRGITIEVNARETYFPATMRFSLEYQQNTNINQSNRFKYLNFIDCDRSFGSILKMSIKDRYIRIGQQLKIGFVTMFNQISKDSGNNVLTAATDVLLNPVQYYLGDYGIGDCPESWTNFNNSSYGFDNNRGIWWRLSQDGLTPISILYKINSWATEHGVLRGTDYKIYGTFDPKTNNCIFAFEATGSDAAFTLTFDEKENAFKSFFSYHPEMMCTIGSLLITWKDGTLYTHDSATYNNFYGVQYISSITPVFNDHSELKKKFLAIGYKSLNNTVWVSPTNGDITTSGSNSQTQLPQISQLIEGDYELEEIVLCASFLNDANSLSNAQQALINGDYLSGAYIVVKLILPTTKSDVLSNIVQPYVTWVQSNRVF